MIYRCKRTRVKWVYSHALLLYILEEGNIVYVDLFVKWRLIHI